MGRYRSRSRSYSPRRSSRSPPRRKRYDDPRDRYRGGPRRYSAPSGLLVRNISLDARPEDLRIPFERFGPVKDVYLPKNYYTGEPRGFGFVKFRNAEDAAEAKQQMNHQVIGGREITIVFAEENRKTPQEMRTTARVSSRYGGGSYRRRSPPRSPRRRYRSYSRSPSPRRDSRERGRGSRDDYSPPRSVSPSPRNERDYKAQHKSSSPRKSSRSPSRSHSPSRSRSRSPSPSRSRSRSPSPSRSRSRSRSYSPR
ncbi:serine/arginine-rich SC35-like splicing factor SCL28 [Magnolia sinica]|uniref:serine/arginine-rich SC35-like splicing factor SCL28 n=1 Tax=Magnolia sinica TaxID=86752 RepID=UPI0026586E64|nr:serine/arginine-rich SC35-like splicing factor SCL28 [Magnolia sinica]